MSLELLVSRGLRNRWNRLGFLVIVLEVGGMPGARNQEVIQGLSFLGLEEAHLPDGYPQYPLRHCLAFL